MCVHVYVCGGENDKKNSEIKGERDVGWSKLGLLFYI